jgi:ribonuclease HI
MIMVIVRKKLIVNFDGLCEPANPGGITCYGFVVRNDKNTALHKEYGIVNLVKPFSPEANNDTAEYGSAIKAMEWLVENGYSDDKLDIQVKGDSQLVTRKLKSRDYSRRAAKMSPMYEKAVKLRSKFGDGIRFEWVKRDQNTEADELAKKAYYSALRNYPELREKVREHWATMLWLESMKYIER